jgi:hypothetical protein
MLLEDAERCEVEAVVEKVTIMLYRAAVHLQGNGCEPDLVFAANEDRCWAERRGLAIWMNEQEKEDFDRPPSAVALARQWGKVGD